MAFFTLPTQRGQNRKAGLSVATINIPLSISLAIASGLDPLTGLLTGIWWCGLAAFTASSKHNVFGIAWALSGIILLFVREFGAERLPVLTFVSGLLIVMMRFLWMVKYITLIPASALHGFVIGVGLIILGNQLPDLVGLHTLKASWIVSVLSGVFAQIASRDWVTVGVGWAMLAFLLVRKRFVPSFPWVLIATVVGAGIWLLGSHFWRDGLTLLRDKYPELQFSLFAFPTQLLQRRTLDRAWVLPWLLKTAFVIAIIAVVETIVSAKIAAKMTKEWFDKEQEVRGLGITNVVGWFFGIAPTTAVFVRTALNIKSWATATSAALMTAIATAVISLFLFKNFFLYIPLTVIAAILISIAIGMVNIRLLHETSRIDRKQWILMWLVALITLFEDPIFGIAWGVIWTLLLQIADKTKPHLQCSCFEDGKFVQKWSLSTFCSESHDGSRTVLVVKLPSEITYLNTWTMSDELAEIPPSTTVIFSCSQLYSIDLDGLEVIDEMIDALQEKGCVVHLTGTDEIEQQLVHLKRYPIFHHENRIRKSTSACLDECL